MSLSKELTLKIRKNILQKMTSGCLLKPAGSVEFLQRAMLISHRFSTIFTTYLQLALQALSLQMVRCLQIPLAREKIEKKLLKKYGYPPVK
jgi:hypothetical protein